MKIILADEQSKDRLMRELSKQHHGMLKDVNILSLSSALKEKQDDALYTALSLSQALQTHKEQFPIYQDMFAYPAFINEILTFTKQCILYGIQDTDLPEDNDSEKELAEIVSLAMHMYLAVKDTILHKEERIQSLINKDIEIYDQSTSDMYHYNILNTLKKHCHYHSYPESNPSMHIRYALNARQELEAIAQDIVTNNVPCNVILTSYSNQYPLLQSVFTRYQIPYTASHTETNLHIPVIFDALVNLALRKDKDSFLYVLRAHGFSKKCPGEVYSYLKQTLQDTSMPEHISDVLKDSLFESETEHYKQSEKSTQLWFESIEEEYNRILSSDTPVDIITNAYEIMRLSPYLNSPDELKEGMKIRQSLMSVLPLVKTEEDVNFITSSILQDQAYTNITESDFCTVTDMTHPVIPAENTYIVDVSGANYPGVPVESGLFDEAYTEKIPAYPSQSDRYAMHMAQLTWLTHSAEKELTFSFHTNDYQGREIQLAFDIENTYPLPQEKWTLKTVKPLSDPVHHLTPDTAVNLFSKDGTVTGSISTIEKWFSCPYAYFIQSGLKVRKQDTASLAANSIGTIQHAIMEHAVKDRGKDYPSITKEELETMLEPSFHVLETLHPDEKECVSLTKERMLDGLLQAMDFLKVMEASTSYEPYKEEYKFKEKITDHVLLRGTIDRIDTYNDQSLRILDYKSSLHKLSETSVKAGTQLQLLSYLIIASDLFHKEPAGAYYDSLKAETYDVPACKASAKSVDPYEFDEESEKQRSLDNSTLKGWTFVNDTTELDHTGSHITSINLPYDYEKTRECIIELYNYFYKQLTDGNISLDPDENACKFCDYHCICRYQGQKRKEKPLVMSDEKLRIQK